MPLVQARYVPGKITENELFAACREIVPAGMHSPKGPLTPGSIEFCADPVSNPRHITVDAFLAIEAFNYKDRRDLDYRAAMMRMALSECFGGRTFAVWPKLVTAGWSSDSTDPDFDGDMSMDAAIERAKQAIKAGLLHNWESDQPHRFER